MTREKKRRRLLPLPLGSQGARSRGQQRDPEEGKKQKIELPAEEANQPLP